MLRRVCRSTHNVWFEPNRDAPLRMTIGRMVKEESWSTASHSELRLIEKKCESSLWFLHLQEMLKKVYRNTYNEGLKRGITENRVGRSHGTAESLSSLKLIQWERCWKGFIVTPITVAVMRVKPKWVKGQGKAQNKATVSEDAMSR